MVPRTPTSVGDLTTLLMRARDVFVSSVTSSHNLSAGLGGLRYPMSDSSSPQFQTTSVKCRRFTMENDTQWTFTSWKLQSVVSTPIKQSSDPYGIRPLPIILFGQKSQREWSGGNAERRFSGLRDYGLFKAGRSTTNDSGGHG
ncbi:hypothetical protein BC835DRAFT_1410162 [Cytidiella melzeri]|nr:hypothetical protein BC835DRAFT_1410162 [Cytidiella melzeri]